MVSNKQYWEEQRVKKKSKADKLNKALAKGEFKEGIEFL